MNYVKWIWLICRLHFASSRRTYIPWLGEMNANPISTNIYSLLKLFTGLAIAAFMDWKLTVANAIDMVTQPDTANTHHSICVLYAKVCSHRFIPYHARGEAIAIAIIISHKNSADNKVNKEATLAPNTLRMPTSFTLCSAVNIARPNRPKHDINMARNANDVDSLLITCSFWYSF
jgi:hypothetical protein